MSAPTFVQIAAASVPQEYGDGYADLYALDSLGQVWHYDRFAYPPAWEMVPGRVKQ